MAALRLRDRDAIITKDCLIFRVFGYSHPPDAYICDAEYAPAEIFKSKNPKAFRSEGQRAFCKFYEDEGWKFIKENLPQHMVFHEMLRKKVVGVECHNIVELRKPEVKLRKLIEKKPKDELLRALQNVLDFTTGRSGLSVKNFGVFGSLLHGFHHPKFSDIDLTIYGEKNVVMLLETLRDLYEDDSSPFKNEFEIDESVKGKRWKFKNYSLREHVWHQRRKMIYAVFRDKTLRRTIKVEFEPVREWSEIYNECRQVRRVVCEGWVKGVARVKDDEEISFMPSIYPIEIVELTERPKVESVRRIISYVEEFRMQAWKDEFVYVEGNLEKVETPSEDFHQITLTYGPRYYEQVLKNLNMN